MAKSWATRAHLVMDARGHDLYSLAYALTGTAAGAERLMHAGLIRALDVADPDASPHRLADYARRGICAEFIEKARVKKRGRGGKGAAPTPSGAFLTALDSLDAQQRLIVVMRFYEGLSCAAIGREFDTLPTAVRKVLGAALEVITALLGDPHLDHKQVMFGGGTPTASGGIASLEPDDDPVTKAFTKVDAEATVAYRASGLPTGVRAGKHEATMAPAARVVAAIHGRRRTRGWTVAALTTAAVGSLAFAGWTYVEEAGLLSQAATVSPSPEPSGPYGVGVLADAEVLEASDRWSPSDGDDAGQRLLVCGTAAVDPYATPTEGEGIPVSSGGFSDDEFGDDAGDQFSMYQGTCAQRMTDAILLASSVTPVDESSGRTRLSFVVKVRNDGEAPIALYQDSLSIGFELPWGGLSSAWGAGANQTTVLASAVDDVAPEVWGILPEDVVVLRPGESITALVTTRGFRMRDIEEATAGDATITDEMIQEWIRSVSLIGEMAFDDGDLLVDAFQAGDYMPRGAAFVIVAPVDPESTEKVILVVPHEQVGEVPSVEPPPSPSTSASASPSAT